MANSILGHYCDGPYLFLLLALIMLGCWFSYTYNQEPEQQATTTEEGRDFTNYPGQSIKHTHGGHRLRCVGLRGTSVPCWYL